MRVYLPMSHSDLVRFLADQRFEADKLFAPTPAFLSDNQECDDEEIEYRLSVLAGEAAREVRLSKTAPGLVLAIELDQAQCGESDEDSLTLTAPIIWSQVQCALLLPADGDELIWFATQEIAQELDGWK
ncbi:MAG: hypothetical protein O3A27_03050 [Actinomycetota bacterium]|nr:hypothetical protein [Actinomycetota bacterium]